jgi:hypothetical protein
MTATAEKKKSGNLITPLAILSYPYFFKPQPPQNDGEKAKYGCTLVFTPEAQKDPRYAALKAEAIAVARKKWGAEADDLIRAGKLKFPFLSDDSAGYPAGSTFIRPRSDGRPGVVGTEIDPVTGKLAYIENEALIYAGVKGYASVSCYAYEKKMNKGVTFGLGNFQKIADGERLDGRRAASEEFEPVEGTSDADLSGLIGG